MKTATRVDEVRGHVVAERAAGRTIEFVPTMGALHEGHLSLMRAARMRGGCIVVSIFVNPLQFGDREDLASYPREIKGDLEAAEREGVEVAFAPSVEEMYPRGQIETRLEVGRLGEVLEGHFRPGHFSGVATVCVKLFNIVQPDRVYLGQKDAQQVAVLKQVVADLNLPIELVVCPTVRDADGLAMSSRNLLLSEDERKAATVLYQALEQAAERVRQGGSIHDALDAGRRMFEGRGDASLQYLEAVDPLTFQPATSTSGEVVLVIAGFVGSVRLIDNVVVGTGTPA